MLLNGLPLISLTIWIALAVGRRMFWLTRERDTNISFVLPDVWPSVTAIVPARNEADVVQKSIGSLLRQDYPGDFKVILVDDESEDDTAHVAERLNTSGKLYVGKVHARPDGWTGKLWAVSQGVDLAHGTEKYLLLTDADIEHAPDNLRYLVAHAECDNLVLTSLMAKLHCTTMPERFFIPAFVFFFDMLYPFRSVNDPNTETAAAAGGCMLVNREALVRAGGIAAISHEIIDDCAMGRLMKKQGRIWLGLTDRAASIRPYKTMNEIRRMVARSAYAQLDYSPISLVGTLAGLTIMFVVPPLSLFSRDWPSLAAGLMAWGLMALMFQPMLRFYRRSPLWGTALPLIGILYGLFTFDSAIQHWRGRGGLWKGRVQAMDDA